MLNIFKKPINIALMMLLTLLCFIGTHSNALAAWNTMPDKLFPRLVSVAIASGNSPDASIELYFTNNVGKIDETQEGRYNMDGYNEQNKTKFTLYEKDTMTEVAEYKALPAEDATKHEDSSRFYYVHAKNLDPQKDYYIVLAEDFYANMGNSLGVEYYITFNIAEGSINFDKSGPLPNLPPQAPLKLDHSNLTNNATNVGLLPAILLSFSNNVTEKDVIQNSIASISLRAGDMVIPISVKKGEEVTDLIIKPISALTLNTQYRLLVNSTLAARNGSTLSSPLHFNFTTRKEGGTSGPGDSDLGEGPGTDSGSDGTITDGDGDNDGEDYSHLFSDINTSWAKKDIALLTEKNIVTGNPDGSFKPNDNISRAEIAAILVRAFELETVNTESNFVDIQKHWAKNYINTAIANNIANGMDDNNFAPNAQSTREQLATMLIRASKLELGDKKAKEFKDANNVSSWATDFVNIASAHNIIGGYEDNTFKPNNNVTRAETCRMVVNLLKATNKLTVNK